MSRWVLCLALLFCVAAPGPAASPAAAGGGTVDGLAAFKGDFQESVRVFAFRDPVFDPGKAAASSLTDASGRFSLGLAPGKYYLVAHGGKGPGNRIGPGDLYCFYSGNPVRVTEGETVHVGFNMVRVPGDGKRSPGFTGVEGRLLFEGQLLGRAYLYVYRDASDEFRGMGFMTAPIGPEGTFKLRLPPGDYFLIGRKRQEGGMYGPLRKNDKVAYYYGNPVRLQADETLSVELEAISRIEMLEEIWFEKETAGAYLLTGSVRNAEGKTLPGVRLLLYASREMSGKPRYISSPTDDSGAFRVEVYDDGTYFLLARQSLGGPPEENELYGRHLDASGEPAPVTLGPGRKQAAVDLVVRPYGSAANGKSGQGP